MISTDPRRPGGDDGRPHLPVHNADRRSRTTDVDDDECALVGQRTGLLEHSKRRDYFGNQLEVVDAFLFERCLECSGLRLIPVSDDRIAAEVGILGQGHAGCLRCDFLGNLAASIDRSGPEHRTTVVGRPRARQTHSAGSHRHTQNQVHDPPSSTVDGFRHQTPSFPGRKSTHWAWSARFAHLT